MFNVKELALQKHSETGHTEKEWALCLESARQSLKFTAIDYLGLEQLALASGSPQQFTIMGRLIYHYGKSHPQTEQIFDLILESVDSSPFPLSQWISSVEYFYHWLINHHRKLDLLKMLGYLRCCVNSSEGSGPQEDFLTIVKEMLETCGYDG